MLVDCYIEHFVIVCDIPQRDNITCRMTIGKVEHKSYTYFTKQIPLLTHKQGMGWLFSVLSLCLPHNNMTTLYYPLILNCYIHSGCIGSLLLASTTADKLSLGLFGFCGSHDAKYTHGQNSRPELSHTRSKFSQYNSVILFTFSTCDHPGIYFLYETESEIYSKKPMGGSMQLLFIHTVLMPG